MSEESKEEEENISDMIWEKEPGERRFVLKVTEKDGTVCPAEVPDSMWEHIESQLYDTAAYVEFQTMACRRVEEYLSETLKSAVKVKPKAKRAKKS